MHRNCMLHLRNLQVLTGYPAIRGRVELVRMEELVKQEQAVKGTHDFTSSKNDRYQPHPETHRKKGIFKKMLSASVLLF